MFIVELLAGWVIFLQWFDTWLQFSAAASSRKEQSLQAWAKTCQFPAASGSL